MRMDWELIKILPQLSDISSMYYLYHINYRKAAAKGMAKAYRKCGDLLYSGKGCGYRNKTEAYKCYMKASSLGDNEATNSMGLMIETGFDDRPADPEAALEFYRKAAKNGSLDALINQAAYHLNSADGDKSLGRLLLLQAYKGGNQRASDYMIHFEIFKTKKEIEAATVNFDEEYLS
jgi:TPR repeat protein